MSKARPNKAKPLKRASSDERQDRSRDIDALLDKGHKPADIARAMEKRYGISKRQAERDIQQVKAQRSQYLALNTSDSLRSEHYSKLAHIYQYALQKEDFSTALKVLAFQDQLIDKLTNPGAKENAAVSSSSAISTSDLADLMAALESGGQAG
ncbi:hypothetical protein [Vampirovibrio sp.]|uniref:hypothetical protein n=1 Tax=Vampirovibrio sp. TaxID=2717857 RepID=UPI00359377C4